ncbi:hypothetical protein EOL96_03225 [Candidatus Saccharibacteria bacterium]|nr:hypothetical protein [Candidatus Saccharibacteria bacterium]
MLLIGHRGAAGLAPENSLAAMQAGYNADADMLELDVRLTKDKKLVAIHDSRLLRTHHTREPIASITYEQLCTLTAESPVPLLEHILDRYFGVIMLNIELKSRGSAEALIVLLRRRYIKKVKDWDKILISSFKGAELLRIRRLEKHANLAMLHSENPFIFVAYHRFVKLTAVGFHRLYLNRFALEIAKRIGLFIYVYTVDRPAALPHLEKQGISGVVTNHPDRLRHYIEAQSPE